MSLRSAGKAAMEKHCKELKEKEEAPTVITFSALANDYLDDAARRFATKTYKYKAYVFREFIKSQGDIPADQITIRIIKAHLKTRHSNTNYNRHSNDLCALFSWAWKRKLIPENPCFFLDKMPEPKYQREIPSEQEMNKILLAAGTDRPFLLVLYHTMARLDEALRMRWEDVSFEGKTVRLWTRKRRDGSWESDLIPTNQVLYDTLWGLYEKRTQND